MEARGGAQSIARAVPVINLLMLERMENPVKALNSGEQTFPGFCIGESKPNPVKQHLRCVSVPP